MRTPGSHDALSPHPSSSDVERAVRCNFQSLDWSHCLAMRPGLAPGHRGRAGAANSGPGGCPVCFANWIARGEVLSGHVGLVAPTWL
jgi:hypothetical protein